MTLWHLPLNQTGFIESFSSTLDKEFQLRLEELGFETMSEITCLQIMPFNGPKVFRIGDGVFSLTRDLAEKIAIKFPGSKP